MQPHDLTAHETRDAIATGDLSNGRPAIIVRDIATRATTATLLGHSGPLTSLAFSSDNTRLVSGSEDKTARVWDLQDAKFPEVVRFAGHAGAVRAVAFNPGATQVLSGADDNSLKLWAVADGSEQVSFVGHTGPVVGVVITSANQQSELAKALGMKTGRDGYGHVDEHGKFQNSGRRRADEITEGRAKVRKAIDTLETMPEDSAPGAVAGVLDEYDIAPNAENTG